MSSLDKKYAADLLPFLNEHVTDIDGYHRSSWETTFTPEYKLAMSNNVPYRTSAQNQTSCELLVTMRKLSTEAHWLVTNTYCTPGLLSRVRVIASRTTWNRGEKSTFSSPIIENDGSCSWLSAEYNLRQQLAFSWGSHSKRQAFHVKLC